MSSNYPSSFNQRANAQTQPVMVNRRRRRSSGCLGCFPLLVVLVALMAGYFLAPFRHNILILGIDHAPGKSSVSRSDTIILTTIKPLDPYVGLLSVPRDLWLTIPGIGENRINTAHFFAEAAIPGSGPAALKSTVALNFGVQMDYYVRLRFEGFKDIVNAMGGVDITLDEPRAGYDPGQYHLTGNKALAFARQRMGADDFFRMENGQLLVKAILQQMARPGMWWRIPAVAIATAQNVETDIPIWLYPRLGLAIVRVGPAKLDTHTIDRNMASPFFTTEGASVLLPDWNQILPLVKQIFDS